MHVGVLWGSGPIRRRHFEFFFFFLHSVQILFVHIDGRNRWGLTAIWLATNPRSGYFSPVLVDTPALSPVTLLLPVVAVLVAAGDESTWHSHTKQKTQINESQVRRSNLTNT